MIKKIIFFALLYSCFTWHCCHAEEICNPECHPDLSCKDILKPGQVCPSALAQATLNTHYQETMTVIPPSVYEFGEAFGNVKLTKIVITEIEGLPPGIQWCKNQEDFPVTEPNSHYCCQFYGTPTATGEYPLKIKIKPYFIICFHCFFL